MLDRVVSWFNPAAAVDRLRARTLLGAYSEKAGYSGGKRGRKATWNFNPEGGSADADLLPDLPTLRARARDLARNVPIASGAVQTNKTHVIGDGLVARSACDWRRLGISEDAARQWNADCDAQFALAAKTLDFTKVEEFGDLQDTVFGAELESGDVFAVRRWRVDPGDDYGTKVQVIEADRVCNPNYHADTDTIRGGIEHDTNGVPIAIHVADRHPGDLHRRPTSWRRVPMRYRDGRKIVLHIINRHRPDQTRGIPYFAGVIEHLKSFGDYSDAEVRAAVVSAMFTVFVKSAAGEDAGPLPQPSADDNIALGNGAIVSLQPDEDIEIANPGRPNPNFDAFTTAFLRQVGVALELPYELLIKHFTASYSASRAALEMAYHGFRKRRSRFARQFCSEVRSWVIEEAIITGRLRAPGYFDDSMRRDAWLRAEWTGPVRISLDPKKDAEADERDRKNGFKTSAQIMLERTGGEFDAKTDTIKRENERLAQAGVTMGDAPAAADPAQADPADLKEDMNDA